MPVDVLEIDRFLPGLLEGSGKLVSSPAVFVFRPVSDPRVRPQGQRCARVGAISPLIVERNMDLGRLTSLPKESMGTSRALSKRTTAPLFEVVARLADNCILGLFLEDCHVTDGSRRVLGTLCNLLELVKYFAKATFAGFQMRFKNHAPEVWAHGVPEVRNNSSALFDPFVSLNEQG